MVKTMKAWLPTNRSVNQLQFNVAVSDVTFGTTSSKCGISKWSLITPLTPDMRHSLWSHLL